MGRHSKAQDNGLVELIVSKSDGGKNTIVYVTDEVNRYLEENGLKVRFSRESIRRVIKSHREEVEDAKKSIEAAKAMAEILRDNPGTEATEATVMVLSSLITKEIRSIDSMEFEDPKQLVDAITKLADTQLKMSSARTKAVSALEKAKAQIKEELREAITQDADLLEPVQNHRQREGMTWSFCRNLSDATLHQSKERNVSTGQRKTSASSAGITWGTTSHPTRRSTRRFFMRWQTHSR